ncbi:MAG: hypothetical protein H6740_15025 [Alphaproteobacteria bacterium]|nr:hypothetical protein [Alphaproteobacteria bacterium]
MTEQDQMEGAPPLAELFQGHLDEDALDALMRDLSALAQVHEVRLKAGATQRADDRPMDLARALEALRGGQARAMQISYRYQGATWSDTLLKGGAGYRLVRMQHPAEEA